MLVIGCCIGWYLKRDEVNTSKNSDIKLTRRRQLIWSCLAQRQNNYYLPNNTFSLNKARPNQLSSPCQFNITIFGRIDFVSLQIPTNATPNYQYWFLV